MTTQQAGLRIAEKLILIGVTATCFKCRRTGRRIIVRSRAGGFVTQNCEFCGHPEPIRMEHMPALNCRRCGRQMEAIKTFMGNYAYGCRSCQTKTELWTLVPHWDELFAYDGYAIESDLAGPQQVVSPEEP